jgi:hypothetical protein
MKSASFITLLAVASAALSAAAPLEINLGAREPVDLIS